MNYYLGLDVGGTNMAAGVVDEAYRIIAREEIPSGAGRSIEAITSDMARVSRCAAAKAGLAVSDFSSWGIGMPSCVNPSTGLLIHANCFGWHNVPIYHYLEQKLDLPVYIENDANCAVLGEMLAGCAKGMKNVLMLTLGTGVGSGIILDGQLYTGADGMGAEFGHTKLIYGGKKCTCGQSGCVDAYCSARGLKELAISAMYGQKDSVMWEMCVGDPAEITAKSVFEAAGREDALALRILDQYLDYLSAAISSFVAVFRPEAVILGGGVAEAGEELLVPLRRKLYENTFAGKEIGVPILMKARCGNDAGIIGAAFLQTHRKKQKRL